MSSDNPSSEALITLIPLGSTYLHGSLLSDEVYHLVCESIQKDEKILMLYNRRGSGRAWICQDCSYFPLCPHCDIALAYHTSPRRQLICHHCNHRESIIVECPKCHGTRFQSVGIGLQKIATELESIFPDIAILRLDSDTDVEKSQIVSRIDHANIILGTHAHVSLFQRKEIPHGVFLLFESDLTLPDYRMEEDIYHTMSYAKRSGKHLFIQTYIPEHPLLRTLIEGNYRDFLRSMSDERKKFHYPPYEEFVQIRIHDPYKEKVQDILQKLVNKIMIMKSDDIFIAYDTDIWEKLAGEWVQKIILKGKNLDVLLAHFEVEIIRNRSVNLERK